MKKALKQINNTPKYWRSHIQIPFDLAQVLRARAEVNDRPFSKEIVRLLRVGLAHEQAPFHTREH